MLLDDAFDRAAGQIADGEPVDWPAIEEKASTSVERERTASLRIVDAVARAHRALPQAQDASRMWGRYRLTQVVGAGSYGSVYRAFDPELEREVAVKILHRQFGDSKLRERLLREGRALAKVRHPHVVNVIGVESYGDRVGLCMEFVYGQTLDEVLRTHGTMNAREATLVGQDVCRALSAVHSAGYVHRDVKAGNIMRDRTGRIVLMDFGAGREIDESGRSGPGNIAGTPVYMAPEVLAGEPATTTSDVYSVGVLLYHLVTGKYPVDGATVSEVKTAHMFGRRTRLSERRSDLPLPFVQLVDRALAPSSSDRWPSAGALLEALSSISVPTSSHLRKPAIVAAALMSLASVVTVAGCVTSYYANNLVLGRADYIRETPLDWVKYGAMSLASTVAILLMIQFVLSIVLAGWKLIVGTWRPAQRIDAMLKSLGHRLRLDDVSVASCWALLAAATSLAVTWWVQEPFLEQLLGLGTNAISMAPGSQIAFLAHTNVEAHLGYRAWFLSSTIICAAVWIPVFRLASRKREPISRFWLINGVAVFTLSLLLFSLPYRLLIKSDMESATWRGTSCYIFGEQGDDFLVFCPDHQPPRSHVVNRSAPDLQRRGLKEDILTRIQATP